MVFKTLAVILEVKKVFTINRAKFYPSWCSPDKGTQTVEKMREYARVVIISVETYD